MALDIKTTDITSLVAYLSSAIIAIGGEILNAMNNYAPAFGVMLGCATWATNWHFQRKRVNMIKANNSELLHKTLICPRECKEDCDESI
jgi:hypothetical protein